VVQRGPERLTEWRRIHRKRLVFRRHQPHRGVFPPPDSATCERRPA
jgi:hypothetical protein